MSHLPAYIGGFRSGTTLLVNLLGQHPELVPWFETKELCELLRWLRVLGSAEEAGFESRYCVPDSPPGFALEAVYARMWWHMQETQARLLGVRSSGKASHERYPIGHDHVRYSLEQARQLLDRWRRDCLANPAPESIRQASAELLTALARAQCAGAMQSAWINKTPEISRFAPELRALQGPIRIIYMVRNGLEVVASASKLGWGQGRDLAYDWQGLLTRTRLGMQEHPRHYLELRYEHLLEAPEQVLDQVFDFLGLAPLGTDIVSHFRQQYGSSAFSPGRAALQSMPREILQHFVEVAGPMQQALGYPMPVI